MTDFREIRKDSLSEIKRLIIGPYDGDHEVVSMRLTLRYMTGILFPMGSKRSQLNEEVDDELSGDQDSGASGEFSGDNDNPLSLANEDLPSSVGLSFCLPQDAKFECDISAGNYKQASVSPPAWQRTPLAEKGIVFSAKGPEREYKKVLEGRGELIIYRRPSPYDPNVALITVSLKNDTGVDAGSNQNSKESIEARLYQIGLKCTAKEKILPYVNRKRISTDIEDEILDLQYSFKPTFAAAHGCSVNWASEDNKKASAVWVEYLPEHLVKYPEFNLTKLDDGTQFEDPDILRLADLKSSAETPESMGLRLESFVGFYEKWVFSQSDFVVESEFDRSKKLLISEMQKAVSRMRDGIELLKNNDDCFKMFQLANAVMHLQMEQNAYISKEQKNRAGKKSFKWPIGKDEEASPIGDEISLTQDASWRPFQLAFFLLVVADLEDPERETHELNDLIWFSTGGGKTEAYLFLAAYELLRRRQRYSSPEMGAGTSVITRYTLRFLTADQFARTASLIVALEKIRSKVADLGAEPFSLGLYVGGDVTYNKLSSANGQTAGAIQDLQELYQNVHHKHKFQIDFCPNCGTELIPSELKLDSEGEPDRSYFGYKIVGGDIETRCTNHKCMFHSKMVLPIYTIDDQIMERSPSILLGTIDKFAMMAFKSSSPFFGVSTGMSKRVPPTLVIQDELHLISGPLGTIGAIYESAFDTIIRTRMEALNISAKGPKYISSSATVREADNQVLRLMGRKNAIFPPRGISASDSFFARDTKEDNGRLYVGLMAQGLNSTTAAHWSTAALLQAVRFNSWHDKNKKWKPSDADFLWSAVVYCNSKRELGLINSAIGGEIIQRMRVYADVQGLEPDIVATLRGEEISSDKVDNITEARSALQIPVEDDVENSLVRDVIPATNMMSVGIDISRLGLMLVNGQPKTTAEYIQASSRVGRNPKGNGPGLVFTLYSPAKPRDRSHYESFVAYHQSLYRLVEPTSVTPGSWQALSKAAHAAVVIAVRHLIKGMSQDSEARSFDSNDPETKKVIDRLKHRLVNSYQDEPRYAFERAQIIKAIDEFVSAWMSTREGLRYGPFDNKDSVDLLKTINRGKDYAKLTMESMRSVDVSLDVLFKKRQRNEGQNKWRQN